MKHLARSTLIIAVFFGLEKILGFGRNLLIARVFGLSQELDAFNAANNIPDLVFALISGGALAMAFIPVLSEYRETKPKTEMWGLFSQVANAVFLVTAAVSILVALFSNQLVSWEIGIAPGFGAEQKTLVADLMRLNLIATLLFSLGGLAIAGLQAQQHFLVPALAPSMYDIGSLIGILILAPEKGFQIGPITLPAFGLGVYGLVYGVVLGAALFLLIQIPALFKFGFRWQAKLKIKDPGFLQVVRLMAPRVLTVFFIQLVFIMQDNLASRLPTGAVTALVYGWLFMQLPESLIGTALGTALLPTLSEQIANREVDGYRKSIETVIRVITGLMIPIAVILALNLEPVIALLGFDAAGTKLVLWTVRAYLVGLLGHSLLEVSARSFYARQNAKTPLLASGGASLLFLVLAIPLANMIGAPGIGLANSVAYTAEAILLFVLLHRLMPFQPRLRGTLLRSIGASAVAVALSLAFQNLIGYNYSQLINAAIASLIIAAAGVQIIPWLLPELKELLNLS
jgi:putative peptidoglycan lipid II flippase